MAFVLCTGVDRGLMNTRRLILQRAGHVVETAIGEEELLAAFSVRQFDIAVIGQMISLSEKQRIMRLTRQHCPGVKVLELFSPFTGEQLPDADDWLEVPAMIPYDLATRVSALAGEKSSGPPSKK